MNIRRIPSQPDLGATEDGKIWRLKAPRTGRNAQRPVPYEMRQWTLKNGYRVVNIGELELYVHRLVLEAFVGPCPDGYVGAHADDDKFNNKLENLRWASQGANAWDRLRNSGCTGHYNRRPDVLSKGDVEWIRAYPKRVGMFREMADRLQISENHTYQVYYGLKWSHVPGAHRIQKEVQ